ncbi:MAG: SUMF1/EgtB/PvdO family nonheme iron enzyme [Kiritimatiellae bacterium]|jgi:sulfatase modifying factor 1|nr:SUMF1/EgtB/PvdO family nonheme iron enzyme [Kiritimatiellia bacterium]
MKIKLICFLIIVVALSALVYVVYFDEKEDTGSLQVHAISGFDIYVDNELRGKTIKEDSGLILEDLPAGTHEVRVEKKDLEPQCYKIVITPSKKAEITLTSFVSKRESQNIPLENVKEILYYTPEDKQVVISMQKKYAGKALVNSEDMQMVYIVPGSFFIESKGEENAKDVVKHKLTISKPFMISKYEVTQKQYQDVMSYNPSHFVSDNNPVEKVSWNDAVTFCKTLTNRERKSGKLPIGYEYRLPTEAEWEYVASCGDREKYKYSGSSELDLVGWFKNNSEDSTHPVGLKTPNDWNVYDMSGNVWEWCQDWHNEYPSEDLTDPKGASSGTTRVVRGGSWYNSSWFCGNAYRFWFNPSFKYFNLGFRVCLSEEEKDQ